MLSLVRSGLLHMIALVMVLLPVCVLVAHVYTPYGSGSNSVFTFRLSLTEPVQSPHEPVQSRDLPLVNRMAVSSTSVVAGPSLSADFLNRVLASAGSPAAGTGQALADLSRQYHIDDAYALAVFQKESSFGRSGAGFLDHALGNIVCAGYPTCNGRFRSYASWGAGYADFYQLITTEYVGRGLSTVETITPVYAPSAENDTGLYIQQVRQSMLAFRRVQSLML